MNLTRLVYMVFYFLCPLDVATAFCTCVEWAKIPRKRRICPYILSNWMSACRLNPGAFLPRRGKVLSLLARGWGQKLATKTNEQQALLQNNLVDISVVQSCLTLVQVRVVNKQAGVWKYNNGHRFYQCQIIGLSIRVPVGGKSSHAVLSVFYDAWGMADLRSPRGSGACVYHRKKMRHLPEINHVCLVDQSIPHVGHHCVGILNYQLTESFDACHVDFTFANRDGRYADYETVSLPLFCQTSTTSPKQGNIARILSSLLWQMSKPGSSDSDFIPPNPDRWSHVPVSVAWAQEANRVARKWAEMGHGFGRS